VEAFKQGAAKSFYMRWEEKVIPCDAGLVESVV
jgi:hypothetical protein